MEKAKIGLVGLCSQFESGGERHDELISSAAQELEHAGLDVVVASRSVWNSKDALKVCEQFQAANIDAVAIMDVTWVFDSLKYVFAHQLKVPMVFWAVPYPETFSIGCVQNFGSALKTQGIHFEYVYALTCDRQAVDKVCCVARAGQIIRHLSHMRLALVGPRQTWRVAGPQDMTLEEWDFSEKLGPTILHIEMDEILNAAREISDACADAALQELKPRTGHVKCSDDCMRWCAKVYLATMALVADYGLDGIAAECYPNYSGQLNQAASWLADEGIIVDTEGDIAHAFLQYILNMAAQGGACALGEVGAYTDAENYLSVLHEGSTAASLAERPELVAVNPSGEMGTFIGFPMKAMDKVTFCDLQGSNGNYQLFVAKGRTLPVSHQEWVDGGEKLVMKLRADQAKPSEVISKMIDSGFHHHLVVKEGDHADILKMVCSYSGIRTVIL